MLKNFIWDYRFIIAVAILAIVYFLFEREKGKNIILNLMFQAKRLAKDAILKSGQEQENWVVERALFYLPMSWKIVITETQIRKIVKWLFNKGKDYLDDGKINGSV